MYVNLIPFLPPLNNPWAEPWYTIITCIVLYNKSFGFCFNSTGSLKLKS